MYPLEIGSYSLVMELTIRLVVHTEIGHSLTSLRFEMLWVIPMRTPKTPCQTTAQYGLPSRTLPLRTPACT